MTRVTFSLAVVVALLMGGCSRPVSASGSATGRYAALDKWPALAGAWAPVRHPGQGVGQELQDRPPLSASAAAERRRRLDLERKGKPYASAAKCLPHGGGAFWTGPSGIYLEYLPRMVLLWGHTDFDGNNLRYIYTDGRKHSDYVDRFLGDSVGHWEGDTLVVDTVGFRPDVPAAFDIESGGGMHVVERFHLTGHDQLQVDVTITAPHVLTSPYRFTRTFARSTRPNSEPHEAVCLAGMSVDKVDAHGNQYLETTPPSDLVIPPGVRLR